MRTLVYFFNYCFVFCLFISFVFCQQDQSTSLNTYEINNVTYINIGEFIAKNNLESKYYNSKEKLELKYKNKKIYFSPSSSFCKINEKTYHLVHPTIYNNQELFIPLYSFYNVLLKEAIPIKIDKTEKGKIFISKHLYDIEKFTIFSKTNGTVIQISTNKRFLKKDVAYSLSSSHWLNLTILNCQIDSNSIKNIPLISPIFQTQPIQLNESSQISFLVSKNVEDVEVEIDEKSINILLKQDIINNADQIIAMREKWLIDTIVIDPGHGGKDPGAIGINKLKEKSVNLDIAKRLGKLLETKLNVNVVYTRKTDKFVPLWERTKIANSSGGKLFISIHANSNKSSSTRGFETYLLRSGKIDAAIEVAERENAVIEMENQQHNYSDFDDASYILASINQNSFMKESEKLAELIQKHMQDNINSRNRGVKQAGFHVLVGASMPNVLIETGFLSNKKEANQLNKSYYRSKIAESIFDAIVEFKEAYENN